jgi:hypothetical protein
MTFWKWVFKIALQIIPLLIGIDWGRPKPSDSFIEFKPKKKRLKRNFFFD